MLKAIIVDDEEKAIQSLVWELSNFEQDIEVVKTFTKPEEGIEYIKTNEIDCLFLDIEMPRIDGFQFIEKLSKRDFAIVITTAYDEYGIKALKNNALDYLLKPIDTDDLETTINKIKEFNLRSSDTKSAEKFEKILQKFTTKKITISTDGKLIFLEPHEIAFIESDGNYSSIYLSEGKKIVLTKKLKEVNELLPNEHFFRVHNSFIININKIKEFYKTDGYVVLDGNHKIPVSRQRKSEFLDKF